MSRKVLNDEDIRPIRIDLDDGDWADVKSRFRGSDRRAINEALVVGKITTREGAGEDGRSQATVELGEMRLGGQATAYLVRGIIRWGGPGFCVINHDVPGAPEHHDDDENGPCRPVALSLENIDKLDDYYSRLLLNKIVELNPEPVSNSRNPQNGRGMTP